VAAGQRNAETPAAKPRAATRPLAPASIHVCHQSKSGHELPRRDRLRWGSWPTFPSSRSIVAASHPDGNRPAAAAGARRLPDCHTAASSTLGKSDEKACWASLSAPEPEGN